VAPVAREALLVRGGDARAFLQGQLSQDLEGLEPGQAADGLVLEPAGRLVALVRVSCLGDDKFVLDVDAGHGNRLQARLERFKVRVRVHIEPLSWRVLALRGRAAGNEGLGSARGAALALPVQAGSLVGIDLLGSRPTVKAADAAPLHPLLADWARIDAGVPVMGRDLDERTIPAEAGLVARCVSLTKGCYTGQELVARLEARGSRVPRRLCRLEAPLHAGIFDTYATRPTRLATLRGATLYAGDEHVGTLTAAGLALGRRAFVGLGWVRRGVAFPARVRLQHVEADVELEALAAPVEL
jgi:folate-binding protein YgfZ